MRFELFMVVAVLSGCATESESHIAHLPALPDRGWIADGLEHPSWSHGDSQSGKWQVADMNADGRIDYLRFQVPPATYNHRIWTDTDHDGYFDRYSDANLSDSTGLDVRLKVPTLENANQEVEAMR